jgi:hypothetical protein
MNSRLLKSLLRSLPATALVLALPLSAAPALALSGPAATDDVTVEPALSIQIDAESGAVDDDEPLRITVRVDNTTGADLAGGRVRLTAGTSTIGSSSTLHAHLDGSDPLPTDVDLGEVSVPDIPADSSYTSGTLTVPNDRLTMPADYGAVPVSASFTTGGARVDAHDTYIAAAAQPTNSIELAIAMPITAPTGQNGLISSESLATYTAPGGVLSRQVDGAADRDVALAVDPMIVASIRALGDAAPDSATAWLDRLLSIENETFALQFSDADGAVQAAAGVDTLLDPLSLDFAVPGDYTAVVPTETPTPDPAGTAEPDAADPGAVDPDAPDEVVLPTTEELVDVDWAMDGMLWPAEGTVTAADLDVFGASGVDETIVSSGNVADTTGSPAAAQIGEHDALVSDDAVSSALRQAATAVTSAEFADAVSAVSAELAVSAREQGATGRAMLATLDRGWPPTASRLGEALDAVSDLPTVDPIALSDLRSEDRIDVALANVESDASRSGAAARLMEREAQLATFSSVLATPTLLTGRERVQILGLLAVDWVDAGDDWSEALSAHEEQTSDLLGSVSILNSSDVLLVGNESAIPFGVRNDSPYDVRVVIDAVPSNIRLDVGDPQTVDVAAGSRQTVRVPVKAQLGNGDVGLTVTLTSVSGSPVGDPVTATVAVRADWEGIGAVIAVLFVVAMLVAGIVRTILRRRARLAERDAEVTDHDPEQLDSERPHPTQPDHDQPVHDPDNEERP